MKQVTHQTILDSLEGTEIAVVGMSLRVPGAANVDTFWQNLRAGVESVTLYSDDELRAAGVDEAMLRQPNYIKSGAPLDGMAQFDPAFFDFSPRDGAILDPQHRHFLECAWEALEHAGYDPARFDGPIGVYGGSGHNIYLAYNLLTNPELVKSVGFFLLRHTGNDKDFLTTRVSYLFNLKGPSVNVQTACSTSLVAIHLAGQSLLNGECDMALAGGVTINLPDRQGYLYHEGEITSPDGHCRAFDARAEGAIFGSGVGVVVLRRLADAIAAGDTIHAVILGSAINNDGAGKVNYLAPSVDGQAAAVAEAITLANVDPHTITYVEAHGTGTRIGDPIEVTALAQAFRAAGAEQAGYCGLGSVKTNIGHLDTAAGVTGFIKTVQALKHRQLPASLNYSAPNPMIDFAASPFYVNAQLADWTPPAGQPRRAGVNSLGVGGTNAFVILEEAPQLEPSGPSRPWQLLPLSAKSATALDKMSANLAEFLRRNPAVNLADVAYTLQMGRQEFGQRRIVAVRDAADAATALASGDPRRVFSAKPGETRPSVVFMFPGGGAQYPNMGRELYEQEPVYRAEVDRCLQLLRPQLDVDLRQLLFPPADQLEAAAAELERPSRALPALFITEYALAKLWQAWGVQPAALIGHSMGEYTAACLAGVLSLADALALVTLRGQLFETLPEGGMLSVSLPEAELRPLLVAGADIAVINSPDLCVVAGPLAAIGQMEELLAARGVNYRRVKINVAAHSSMLEPILAEFGRRLAAINFNPPQLPFVSNVTGAWITPAEATDPAYWVRHLRHTVRFAAGVGALLAGDARRVFLEVGPGQTLSALARMHPAFGREQAAVASLRHPQDDSADLQFLLTALGRLWLAGVTPDWPAFYQRERRQRIPLPTYPFDHQRCWIEPGRPLAVPEPAAPPLKKLPNLADWFYRPVWKQADLPPAALSEPATWLVFVDEVGLGAAVCDKLQAAGQQVVRVASGFQFDRLAGQSYTLNPYSRQDYELLAEELAGRNLLPQRVLHLWTLNAPAGSRMESFYLNQTLGFESLLYLAQIFGGGEQWQRLTVVTNGAQQVQAEPLPYPEKATLLGPVQVIPREYPQVAAQLIDVPLPAESVDSRQVAQLLAELAAPAVEPLLVYRDSGRWLRQFEPSPLAETPEPRLRERSVVLITGGLGGIGLTLAEYLAQAVRAKLVLVSRSGLPPRAEWPERLRLPGEVSERIQKVQALEALGAEVLVVAVDVTDWAQMAEAVKTARQQFGAIDGVIHAAGVLDDGLIQTRSLAEVNRVLLPKVAGALQLAGILAAENIKPDFMALFSSTSAFLGAPGQVDYTAANAFLNAFAQSQTEIYTVAINWGMWQQVGMAMKAARQMGLLADERPAGEAVSHPLLESCLVDTLDRRVYAAQVSTQRHWLLNEHRLQQGDALIPGTGYLELARAALANGSSNGPVEISDLFFVSPLNVKDNETKEVRTILQQDGAGFSFTVVSKTPGGDAEWQEHARGEVKHGHKRAESGCYPLADIAARCNERVVEVERLEQVSRQEAHMAFGPRWHSLKQVRFGAGEALARLELPAAFRADLDSYPLHPALLDMATAYALPLLNGYESDNHLYVPLSYKRVKINGPLSPQIYSYVRLKENGLSTPTFNVAILDEQGAPLVEIDEFVLKQVDPAAMRPAEQPAPAPRSAPAKAESGLLHLGLAEGITPAEGAAAFGRILSRRPASQVIVTSLELAALFEQIEAGQARPEAGFKLARPENLDNSYEAPRNELEKALVKLWEELLGIDRIGIHDNFFELGGHSLIAVRLFARLKKMVKVDLSLTTLFETPTIAQLAELLRAELGETAGDGPPAPQKTWSHLVAVKRNGSRPPFFCVAGIYGNVIEFYHLTRYLSADQPFYGLQAQGIDGKTPAKKSIAEMARDYIAEIRQLQPDGPYYLGGFSFGGEVAYEMAQQLLVQGQAVALLAMFDTIEPATARYNARQFVGGLVGSAKGSAAAELSFTDRMRRFWQRGAGEKWRSLAGWVNAQQQQRKARARAVDYQAVERLLQQGQPLSQAQIELYLEGAHSEAILNYSPQPYAGRVTMFRTTESLHGAIGGPSTNWSELARGGIDTYVLEGTHDIVKEPQVQILARDFRRCLEAAQGSQ